MKVHLLQTDAAADIRPAILALAGELTKLGYSVEVLNTKANTQDYQSMDGWRALRKPAAVPERLRYLWAIAAYTFKRRGTVHVFGNQAAWLMLMLRTLHPRTQIIVHDDGLVLETGKVQWYKKLSRTVGFFLASVVATMRPDFAEVKEFTKRAVYPLAYPITKKTAVLDPVVLRAHGLEAQSYLLVVLDPEDTAGLQTVVKMWREGAKRVENMRRLAIVYTHAARNFQPIFDTEIVFLGAIGGMNLGAVYAGAYAVCVPSWRTYRRYILEAMSYGKFVWPLRDWQQKNAIAMHDLAHYYQHQVENDDLGDPAAITTLGHIARNVIEAEHGSKIIAENIELIYEEMAYRGLTVKATRQL